MSSNPYAAPSAVVGEVVASAEERERMKRVASGQRMMVWAVLGMLVSNGMTGSHDLLMLGVGGLLAIVCLVFAIIGVVRLARALGSNGIMCTIAAICMIIPLANLIVMILMSMRATRALKAAGFKVGLLGARDI